MPQIINTKLEYTEPNSGNITVGSVVLKFAIEDCAWDLAVTQTAEIQRIKTLLSEPDNFRFIITGKMR